MMGGPRRYAISSTSSASTEDSPRRIIVSHRLRRNRNPPIPINSCINDFTTTRTFSAGTKPHRYTNRMLFEPNQTLFISTAPAITRADKLTQDSQLIRLRSMNDDVHTLRRRIRLSATRFWMATCCCILILAHWSPGGTATAFVPSVTRSHQSHVASDLIGKTTQLHVSQDLRGSWSNAGTSSRLGVRKRVKAVLARARLRSKDSVTQTASTSFYPQTRSSSSLVIPQTTTPTRAPEQYYYSGATIPWRNVTDPVELFRFRDTTDSKILPTDRRILTAADDPDDPLSDLDEPVSLASENADKAALPFTLPTLSPMQKQLLAAGERIQEQSKMGREGSGYIVLDVNAPDYVVWECLLDFEKYPERIGTVREMQLFNVVARPTEYDVRAPVQSATRYGTGLETRASFILSKFRLNIAAVHTYQPHPAGHYMEFTLDKSCRNVVLKHAKGIWHTESNPDGKEGVTRVWLLCELQVSSVLPRFIVDYTAKKAMPRASDWIRPTVEQKKREMNISP